MASPAVAAGGVYGSTNMPTTPGSGGGTYPEPWTWWPRGGGGGGAVRLEVAGPFNLDGTLTANGSRPVNPTYTGGGAGGSIFVICKDFNPGPMASLTAVGGDAPAGEGDLSGGGGGGRIALWVNVPKADKATLAAGQPPILTVVTTNFNEFPTVTVSVTNGLGFLSAAIAQPGTVRLMSGQVPPGTLFIVQ